MSYKKVVTYHFEAGGEHWAVTDWGDDWLLVEDTRKNGQEDTHVTAVLTFSDGRWAMDAEALGHMIIYMGCAAADAVEAFVNEHGLPSS